MKRIKDRKQLSSQYIKTCILIKVPTKVRYTREKKKASWLEIRSKTLFANGIILYPMESVTKLLGLKNKFRKFIRTIHKNQSYFYTVAMNMWTLKFKIQHHFQLFKNKWKSYKYEEYIQSLFTENYKILMKIIKKI